MKQPIPVQWKDQPKPKGARPYCGCGKCVAIPYRIPVRQMRLHKPGFVRQGR